MRKRRTSSPVGYLARRYRRKLAIRAKVSGTSDKPRLIVNRTNKNLFAQIIDDGEGRSLFSVRTFGKGAVAQGSHKGAAKSVGIKIAELLKEKNIGTLVFDRNGYKYHGVIAVIVDTLRENGIKF